MKYQDLLADWAAHVVVRGDLDSMNPGKVAAQVHHAATQMYHHVLMTPTDQPHHDISLVPFYKWCHSADGFGTTLVYQISRKHKNHHQTLVDLHYQITDLGLMAGKVIDPSYPIRDGKVTHLVNDVLTCVWFFAPRTFEAEPLWNTSPKAMAIRSFMLDFRKSPIIGLHP